MGFETFLEIEPYSLCEAEKEPLLVRRLEELTQRHRENCPAYDQIW